MASDFCKDLPFLQLLPLPQGYRFQQNRSVPTIPLENKVYVAGLYSDGDNAQFDQNFLKENLFDTPGCGTYPVAFELQMQLLHMAPFVMYRFYQEANINEYFCQGVGGKGYVYWNSLPATFEPTFLAQTLDMMNKTDMRELRTWFEGDFPGLVRQIEGLPGSNVCNGILEGYVGTHPYELPLVYGGMPVSIITGMDKSNKDTVANGTDDEYQKVLNVRAARGNEPAFIMFHIDAWDISIPMWNAFCARVSALGDVQVVRVDQFLSLIQRSQYAQNPIIYSFINSALVIGLVVVAALALGKWKAPKEPVMRNDAEVRGES